METSIDDFADKKWPSIKKDLKKSIGDTSYNNWLKHLSFISIENNTLTLSIPTKFFKRLDR